MSSDLKRAHSDTSEDATKKKSRSGVEREDLPATAHTASPTDPNLSPQSISEQCPPKLTPEEFAHLLKELRALPDTAPVLKLQCLLSLIFGYKPGIVTHFDQANGCIDKANALLKQNPQLRGHLERKEYESVLRTIFRQPSTKSKKEEGAWVEENTSSSEMKRAVVTAWRQQYQGSVHTLKSVLMGYSSGTGKSRMVDELAKTILCLPMNLGSTSAYPPQDRQLREWFKFPKIDDWKSTQCFMCALFEITLQRVQRIDPDGHCSLSEIASKFRDLMSEGMLYGRHGQYRKEFYDDVTARAKLLKEHSPNSIVDSSPTRMLIIQDEHGRKTNVRDAAEELIAHLKLRMHENPDLLVILCFDEAQLLTTRDDSDPLDRLTLFAQVRRALHIIRTLPVFALFLSTECKLEEFSASPQTDSSARIVHDNLTPFAPIVWTPLDVLAQRITKDKVWTLREVASTYHMAHLGRPLFAAMYNGSGWKYDLQLLETFAMQKLIRDDRFGRLTPYQGLACIAVRIPIEFSRIQLSRMYEDDAEVERRLVADHMRLLLYAGSGFSPILTTSGSEPFLAEAACTLMWPFRNSGVDPLAVLSHYLMQTLVDLGPRGEVIAALLLLYARDRATTVPSNTGLPPGSPLDKGGHPDSDPKYDGAVRRRIITVQQFLEALLGEANLKACADGLPRTYQNAASASIPLREAFQDGFIYFNHFIKAQSYDAVNQEYLLLAISRGAAIICPDGDVGVDIVVPVLIGTALQKKKVTAILIQSRNSRHYGAHVRSPVFANMNPYRCGLFDRYAEDPPPVLRMMFALASEESAVVPPGTPRSRGKDGNAKFTAYDIWCAGATHKTFGVITQDKEKALASILESIRDARDVSIHCDPTVQTAMREMQPLVSTHRDNIHLFAEPVDAGTYELAEDAEEDVD